MGKWLGGRMMPSKGKKSWSGKSLQNEICKLDKQKLNVNLFENRYTVE
jgi:hypothetical protein